MKVKCISKSKWNTTWFYITIGKLYNVVLDNGGEYIIENDRGKTRGYNKDLFNIATDLKLSDLKVGDRIQLIEDTNCDCPFCSSELRNVKSGSTLELSRIVSDGTYRFVVNGDNTNGIYKNPNFDKFTLLETEKEIEKEMTTLERIEAVQTELDNLRVQYQEEIKPKEPEYEKWNFAKHMVGFMDRTIYITTNNPKKLFKALGILGLSFGSQNCSSVYDFCDRYKGGTYYCIGTCENQICYGEIQYVDDKSKIVVFE